ncbi:H-2 class I histocompatibility antigen, alpha chain-like [Megalobrama amblycephala]|uniref:H-2 class I histocompatibility antigen, alpha chain-like n=1 Tax=Megalobrama amblycephala TaxID=75352 RepID=UPI0020142269|nr:H-2 class I histocompatibility antigen, alpha chain-like [Megalobrama amblycephala]
MVLTCLATGFYPRDVQMNIRLYRTNLEDQTSSGIRENDDETFQMRISVEIDRNHEGSYDCLLIHSSLTEPNSVEWDGTCSDCEMDSICIITGVIAVFLALIVIGYFIYKRRRSNSETAMIEEKMMMTETLNHHPFHTQVQGNSEVRNDVLLP